MNTKTLPPHAEKILESQEDKDLGFGSVVARESRKRLVNKDGSFNIKRTGLSKSSSLSAYHIMLGISWGRFFQFTLLFYLGTNLVFATAYYLLGSEALAVPASIGINNRFLISFFFSVHTMATIGYGTISPVGAAANTIVTIESFIGLFSLALGTSLLFARFSRPTAKILFSQNSVIAPFQSGQSFQFRVVNGRVNSRIVDLEAKVLYTQFEELPDGRIIRQFYPLELEYKKVSFFELSWTIVHPIDENSPLYGLTREDLNNRKAEFVILLTGFDETFAQIVHVRSSYLADEVRWNAKFMDIFNRDHQDGLLTIDARKLSHTESVERR